MAEDPTPGTMRPTGWRLLLAVGVVGLVVGWFGGALLESTGGVVPTVPWTAVGVLAFAAVVLGSLAWSTWRTVHRRRGVIEARQAVSRLVLGKASAPVGALMAGVYLAFGARFLDTLPAPLSQERVVRSGLAAGAAVLVLVAALLLERSCRVPGGPGEEDDDDAYGESG